MTMLPEFITLFGESAYLVVTMQSLSCFKPSEVRNLFSEQTIRYIYTVGHKKRCHFYFYDNFGKCGPISI